MNIQLGIYDAPDDQTQPDFEVNLLLTNIAVFGSPMSGKTTFVKTLLVRLHEGRKPSEEEIYVIDFGGNLGEYSTLPNVCAVFDNSNEENIKRIFKIIENRLDDNRRRLNNQNYYTCYHRSKTDCPPHLTLIIENINAFFSDDRYEPYRDCLTKLCRDGLSKGLTTVVTGTDTSGLGRLLSYFGQKVALCMTAEHYLDVFGSKVIPPMKLPGRGIINRDSRTYEVQCFLPFLKGQEPEKLEQLRRNAPVNPRKLKAFSEVLTAENFGDFYAGTPSPSQPGSDNAVLGLDYYTHHPVCLDYADNTAVVIYGKRQFGKTNLLRGILNHMHRHHPEYRFVYFDDGRKGLRNVMFHRPRTKEEDDELDATLKTNLFWRSTTASGTACIDEIYLNDFAIFKRFLEKNHYAPLCPTKPNPETKKELDPLDPENPEKCPPTVFIIESKQFFYVSQSQNTVHERYIPSMIYSAENTGHRFIFSDMRVISNLDTREILNRCMNVAFLLDNIGEFINDRGSRSVFGEMDAKEMKSAFARCEIGDGYFYDINSDTLKKVKFLKHPESRIGSQ